MTHCSKFLTIEDPSVNGTQITAQPMEDGAHVNFPAGLPTEPAALPDRIRGSAHCCLRHGTAVPGRRVSDGGKGTYLGGLFPDSAQCLPDCLL